MRLAWSGHVERSLARLHESLGRPGSARAGAGRDPGERRSWRIRTVKKLLLLAVLGLSAFAVWKKVQADRAELNLWTEATSADE
jgi:hypothetical protein